MIALVLVVAAIDPAIITAIAAAILGGGLLGGLAVWRKAGPEADQIVASTLIQVNEHLRQELDARDKRWAEEVERRDQEIERLRAEINRLRKNLSQVQDDLTRVESELTKVSSTGPAEQQPPAGQ